MPADVAGTVLNASSRLNAGLRLKRRMGEVRRLEEPQASFRYHHFEVSGDPPICRDPARELET